MAKSPRAATSPRAASPHADSPRVAVVFNPSKVTDPDAHRAEVCAALADLGVPEPMWLTTTPEDPGTGQTREAVAAGVDTVFACGGDGTVMACATGLSGSDTALAVIPSGTGNLLAANLGLPSDLLSAVEVGVHGERRRVDVGTCGVQRFTVMAGMGFDARMLGSTSEATKARIGWPAYVLGGLRHLRDRPMRLRLRLDDGPVLRRRARSVLVANVGRLTGGITLLPDAAPDDGLFDVAVLAPRNLAHWLALAVGVLLRRPRPPKVETFRAARVTVHSDRPQPRELDGDVIEPGRELSVAIQPGALVLCVPARGEGA